MQLHVVTVRLDESTGEFPPQPLAHLDGELLSVGEYFFCVDGCPHLLLTAQVRPPRAPSEPRSGASRRDPREGLSEAQCAVFDRIRAWRKSRADADGVPAFALLNNRQLREVALQHPTSLAALQKLPGIGKAKAGKWGQELLQVVAGHPVPEAEHA